MGSLDRALKAFRKEEKEEELFSSDVVLDKHSDNKQFEEMFFFDWISDGEINGFN